jgi:8-oxo-dGTP diphosphatase
LKKHSPNAGGLIGNSLIGGGLGSRGLFTPRLTLRWIAPCDAEQLSAFGGDPLVQQKTETIPHPYDVPAAHQWIDEAESMRTSGTAYRFAIEEKQNGGFVGVAALMMLKVGVAELGYWLGRPHWGQGFGREAVAATVAFGEDILRLHALQAVVYAENTASVAVLRGQGFHEVTYETIDVPERGGARLVRRFERDLTRDLKPSNVVSMAGRVA